jgi:maltose-binding protein MalE
VHTEMKFARLAAGCLSVVALAAMGILASALAAQTPPTKTPASTSDQTSRVTIEVSGGENEAPVENASVYIKYVEERKIKKDKKVELNVKTNRDGTAHVPDAPLGRVLIQVVADGWKTYGRWYDIAEAKQLIKVHLEKPPRWY